ncbi:MAG TPA: hypothetical protein VKA36_09305 [Solirubrobacterales bacterium]|nr:hypothetical protein [Solirubrobacterales bacterium]
MGIELLFGLSILALIVGWGVWLFWITRQSTTGIIGGAVLVLVLAGLVLFVNAERQDSQREDYGDAMAAYAAAVAETQETEFEQGGSYAEELPDVDDELTMVDGGILQDSKDLEPDLAVDGARNYTLTVDLEGETFTLIVTRAASGEVTEERTCEGSAEVGCVDGTWEG